VHDAIWRDPPVGDLAWSGVETDTTAASRWPAILAVLSSFLFVVFIGGGVLVGALSLYALSYRQATTGTVVPEPMVRVLETVTGGPSGTVPSADGSRQRMSIFDALPDWEGTEPFHILLLGIDQRDDERDQGVPPRSDTLILARIDPRTKSAGLISFPRDLWVDIPGFGQGRLNTAYTLGELRKVEGGGPGLAKRTMERNFGLKVDYFGRVDFRGFEQIVDTLGGIVVDVERPIKDDEYPDANYSMRRIYFQPGLQRLNGETALWYVRTRHADSDFGRARRQQQFLLALRRQALQLNLLPRAPAILSALQDTFKTDFKPHEILGLAQVAKDIDTSKLTNRVIDESMTTHWVTASGAQVELPNQQAVRRVVQEVFGTAPATPTPAAPPAAPGRR
jgi:LCP family protein required for cell wall assembly